MDESLFFLFVAIFVVGVLLFVAITFTKNAPKKLNIEKYRVKWLTIERQLKKDDPSSCQMAVLNADKLLDHALKERGTRGETMGERMKSSKDNFSDNNAVWTAHKLRNQIAHEPDASVSYDQARRALAAFKRALKDLGAI